MPSLLRCLLLTALLSVLMTSAASAVTVHNPVLDGDYPDPSVVRAGDTFYMVATSKDWQPVFPIFQSRDLATWKRVGSVLRQAPAGTSGNFWAPEISRVRGQFRVYYSASHVGRKPCIRLATARRGRGPYRDRGTVICPSRGAIDAYAVHHASRSWLAWKQMGAGGGLWIAPLNRQGTRITGHPRRMLTPQLPWEEVTTEAPNVIRHDGWWYLLYSAGHCCAPPCTYKVGVARSRHISGPYRRQRTPTLRSSPEFKCPGHGTAFAAGPGQWAFVHHGYLTSDTFNTRRQVFISPLTFAEDRWPRLGDEKGRPMRTVELPLGAASPAHAEQVTLRRPVGWERLHHASVTARFGTAGALLRGRSAWRMGSLWAHQVHHWEFSAQVTVRPDRCAAGVALVQSTTKADDTGAGVEFDGRRLRVWAGAIGRGKTHVSIPYPAAHAQLRAVTRHGNQLTFAARLGEGWQPLATVRSVPRTRTLRVAVSCAGRGTAKFTGLRVRPLS